jgi:DNA-binding IclR family transcriptional regulator
MRRPVMTAHSELIARWTRLEALLTEMKAGDAISVDALVTQTGLPPEIVTTVLKDLERVELFRRQDEQIYVRRSLWESAS